MPFATTDELPAPVREGLGSDGQEQFLAVVNERLDAGDSEEEAFRKAWGAVANAELPEAVADVLTAEQVVQWAKVFERTTNAHADLADETFVRQHAASVAWTLTDAGPGRHEHQETEQGTDLEDVPPEGRRLERLMDREERGLANELRQLVIDYRRDFKRFVRDHPAAQGAEIDKQLDRLRDRYRPKLRQTIAKRAARIRERTQQITLDENPQIAEVVSPNRLPDAQLQARRNADFENSLQLIVDDLARELLNRAEGAATSSHAENERTTDADGEQQEVSIDRPADSTVDSVATQAGSSAVTEGRDDVAQELDEQTDDTVYAIRTSVLDSNTCDPCEDLHGTRVVVGSRRYNRIAPPAKCKGRRRCRCYFEIERSGSAETENRAFRGDGVAVEHASFSTDEGSWHLLYSWGEKQHPEGDYVVDKEFAAKMKQAFNYMQSRHDDHPPIWRNHEDSGFVWGELTDLRVTSRGIEGRLRFNGLAEPYVEHDAIDRLSPTHIEQWTDPETGETLENVLFEVSFVTREHLKSLPTVSEARANGVPPTPDSFSRIEQEAQMPDLEPDQNDNDDTEPSPDVSTDPEAGPDEPTRNMPAGQKFGDFVLDMIKKVGSVPVGPSQDELLDRLTTGTDLSGGDLMERLEAGEMMLPPDALVENVAEEFGVPVADLRAGKFGEADSGGSKEPGGAEDGTPDQPEPPQMEDSEDEQATNADELTDAEQAEIVAENNALRDEVRRLRTTVVREQCAQRGLGEDATERMLRICHDSGFEAYEHAMEAVDGVTAQSPTPEQQHGSGSGSRIGREHGQTGTSPSSTGSAKKRRLAQEAVEQGLTGRDLVEHFYENDAQYDEEAKSLKEQLESQTKG